jgi:hypothetical protein
MPAGMELSPSRDRLALIVVWAVGVALLSTVAWKGWLPQDDGLLAHTAERVLQGELPHRDFDAMYTGGLELLHALAFKLFGIRLASLRLMMLLVASVFVPVFYWLVARVLSPLWAGVVTAGALVWSLPVYFASMPSWHILFLSTFGIASLFKYFDTGRRRWLVVTGVLAGLAVLMKVNGLLFAVAAVLALVFAEQTEESGERESKRLSIPSLLIWVGCGGLALGLLGIVVRNPGVMALVHYAVPGVAIATTVAMTEWRRRGAAASDRFAHRWRVLAPFLLGLIVPIALFLIPYLLSGSLPALAHGLFVLPQRRLTQVTTEFPPAWTLLWGVPFVLLLVFGRRIPANSIRVVAGALAVALIPVAALGHVTLDYEIVCQAIRTIIPIAVVIGGGVLLRGAAMEAKRRRELFTVLSAVAFVSLLQYPFPGYIYFCYVLPLGVLALVYVVTSMPESPRLLHAVVLCFFVVFGALWVAPTPPTLVGKRPLRLDYVPLEIPRAGISKPNVRDEYAELIKEVAEHSADGEAIYAAPDSPEVYFLANRRNPTRTMYDLFDDDALKPERSARLLQTLRDHGVRTVVIRGNPEFSKPIRKSFYEALRAEYPMQRQFEKFIVMWRQ